MRKYYKITSTQLKLAMTIIQEYRQRLYNGEKLNYTDIVDEVYEQYKNLMNHEELKNLLRVILKELGMFSRYFYKYLNKKLGNLSSNQKKTQMRCNICGKRTQKLLVSDNGIDFYHPELASTKGIKTNYIICWNCLMRKVLKSKPRKLNYFITPEMLRISKQT